MLRRAVCSSRTGRMVVAAPTALVTPQRNAATIFNCPCITGVGSHFLQVIQPSTYTTLASLAYSPVGTVALILLAYNVGVIGAKHCWYTLELTAKDYVQDQQLAVVVRYLILLTILLSVEALFIES